MWREGQTPRTALVVKRLRTTRLEWVQLRSSNPAPLDVNAPWQNTFTINIVCFYERGLTFMVVSTDTSRQYL